MLTDNSGILNEPPPTMPICELKTRNAAHGEKFQCHAVRKAVKNRRFPRVAFVDARKSYLNFPGRSKSIAWNAALTWRRRSFWLPKLISRRSLDRIHKT